MHCCWWNDTLFLIEERRHSLKRTAIDLKPASQVGVRHQELDDFRSKRRRSLQKEPYFMRRSCLRVIIGSFVLAILICVFVQLFMGWRGTPPDVIWKFATNDRVPKVEPYKNRVYATKGNVVYALDSKNGKTLWQSETLAGRYISSIFPANDLVFVVSAESLWTERIDALDPQTGKSTWSISGLADNSYGIHPFVMNRHLYAGNDKNDLQAIERTTGKVERTITLSNPVILEPFGAYGLVFYIIPDGRIYATEDESGGLVWATEIPNAPDLTKSKDNRNIFDAYATPSTLFLWEDGGRAILRAFDIKTGKYLWSSQYAPARSEPFYYDGLFYVAYDTTSVSQIGNTVSVGEFQFTLYGVDMATGKLRFKQTYPGWSEFPLEIVGDDLIIGGINVYAVNPKNGDIRWRQSADVPYASDIVIHNHTGYFAHFKGGDEMPTRSYLQAIDLTDGHVVWDRFYLGGTPWQYIYASDDALITLGEGSVTAIQFNE